MLQAMMLDVFRCLPRSYMVAKRDLMGFMEPTKSDISERACEYEDGAFDASAGK